MFWRWQRYDVSKWRCNELWRVDIVAGSLEKWLQKSVAIKIGVDAVYLRTFLVPNPNYRWSLNFVYLYPFGRVNQNVKIAKWAPFVYTFLMSWEKGRAVERLNLNSLFSTLSFQVHRKVFGCPFLLQRTPSIFWTGWVPPACLPPASGEGGPSLPDGRTKLMLLNACESILIFLFPYHSVTFHSISRWCSIYNIFWNIIHFRVIDNRRQIISLHIKSILCTESIAIIAIGWGRSDLKGRGG